MSMAEQISFLMDQTKENTKKILAHQMALNVLISSMRNVLGNDFDDIANNTILFAEKMVEDDPENEVIAGVKETIDELFSE